MLLGWVGATLAEFERELIRARTRGGRAHAKANGKSLGRPFKMTPHQRREAINRRDRGEESQPEIGRSLQRERGDDFEVGGMKGFIELSGASDNNLHPATFLRVASELH
jgi:DNA invertase Pin-like site-specific DNA recombinase